MELKSVHARGGGAARGSRPTGGSDPRPFERRHFLSQAGEDDRDGLVGPRLFALGDGVDDR